MSTLDIVKAVISQSGQNKASIAKAIGVPYSTLCSILSGEKKTKRIEWDLVCALADHFKKDLEYFRGASKPEPSTEHVAEAISVLQEAILKAEAAHSFQLKSQQINCDTFLTWWEQHRGRLENFDEIAPHVDLFEPPEADANMIKPLSSGPISLASVCFKVENSHQLTTTLEGFSSPLNRDLVNAHLEALKRRLPVLKYQSISEHLPDGSLFVGEYRRILAPVTKGGKTFIANFSQECPHSPLGQFHLGSEPKHFQPQR